MAGTNVNTGYRAMSLATLEALRLSAINQLASVQGVGQSHSANGRQTALVDFDKLQNSLVSIESAIEWKKNNPGNNAFASRYASFSRR